MQPSSSLAFVVFIKSLLSWVVGSWGVVLSIVVLGGEVVVDGEADLRIVLSVNFVGLVGVHVVLEVLEHVHVLLNEIVLSDSWELECSILKLPSVDLWHTSADLL